MPLPESITPHGGALIDQVLRLVLDEVALADLELIATGAFGPLAGFLGSVYHARVVGEALLHAIARQSYGCTHFS